MARKKKDLNESDIRKNIVEEECALFVKSIRKQIFKKDGTVKKENGKPMTDLFRDQCAFGHPCYVFDNKNCSYFNDNMFSTYLEYRQKAAEKKK